MWNKSGGIFYGSYIVGASFITLFVTTGIGWAPRAHDLIEKFRRQGTYGIFGVVIPAVIVPLADFVVRRPPESVGLQPDGDAGQLPQGESASNTQGAGVPEAGEFPELTVRQAVRTASFRHLVFVQFFMILGTSTETPVKDRLLTSFPRQLSGTSEWGCPRVSMSLSENLFVHT